jgi:DNA polymerase III subunit alpha
MSPPFVHLHTHTYYSLLDGANPVDQLARKAKACGMPAMAMTDHGNLFGAIEFYQAMHRVGVKPIIGCEVYLLTQGSHTERTVRQGDRGFLSHLTLLAYNQEGYRNLCRLSSIAHLEGFYYKPRIDKDLLAAHHEGLLCLSGCLNGEIARHLLNHDMAGATQAAQWLLHTFGEEQVYFELMRHGLEEQTHVNAGIIDLAQRFSRPVVATNDCHYCESSVAPAHDALLCIQTGKNIDDEKRLRMSSDQFFVRSPEEMAALFHDIPEAISASTEIAQRCHVAFDFDTYHFPKFEAPAGRTLDDLLREQARAGLEARWPLIVRRAAADDGLRAIYDARLEEELDCICTMGFAGYFLIVADFIGYAKSHDVPVGPGRGSAAGSLVAYCLKITDVDPLPFGLFFERFLNPERVSMPDMDIDFCIRGRDAVIQYVQEKYGNVGQIITFGKMKAKAVIRDVARVMGFNYGDADRIAKLIPLTLGITLAEALEQEPQLSAMVAKDPRVAQLMETAQALEGFPRHASTHAAGVVISDQPLTNFLPLYRGTKEEIVTQFDMKGVEKIGLIKFDFLGLKTLTILHDAIALVTKRGGPAIVLDEIPFDDAQVFSLLSSGDTSGIFQLESSGMTDLVVRLRPSVFDEIVALVALFRPGPLGSGMVDDFINRKHGRTQIAYPLPQLEPILKNTYGVILYQEQVMQIASVLANYSLGEADLLRRAMGKKKPEEMAKQKMRFMEGAAENSITAKKAEYIFDLMEKFSGYGFNKSHSVAYALISYYTAYFKTHHPTEFFAALLTNEMGNTDKVLQYLNDAKAHDIEVLPPDINECERHFVVTGERQIQFGLAAVKNVGEGAIESIVEARATGGPFATLFDLCDRIDSRRVNRRVVESLIKCGAFDAQGTERSHLWASVDHALDYGTSRQRERESGQENLFAAVETAATNAPVYAKAEPWSETDRLTGEKVSLGFYITGHPLAQHSTTLRHCASHHTGLLRDAGDRKAVRLGGVVAAVREITTKRGDRMGFVTLEDLHGTVEVVVFAEAYQNNRPLIHSEEPIFVVGTTDSNEETVKIICDTLIPLVDAPGQVTRSIHFSLASTTQPKELEALRTLLAKFAGPCPAYLHLTIPGQSETVMQLPDTLRITPSITLANAVDELFASQVTRFEA